MIKEHDSVVLTADLSDKNLRVGDVGAVVHVHPGKKAFEVEFMTLRGRTVTVATLWRSQIRPVSAREVLHARELAKT